MFAFSPSVKKGKQRSVDHSKSTIAGTPSENNLGSPNDANLPAPDTPPDQPDGSGDNGVHNSAYAARCREIMHLYSELKVLMSGLNLSIQLPRVVVIGGQSSGKSSLVEAVSKINVPRDSGTCTRCPMICEISSDATEWSCSISLDMAGTPGVNEPSAAHMYRRIAFATTADKSAVEILLRRAQAAILNPDRDYKDFLDKSRDELKNMPRQLEFSENKIVVQLRDPEATDVHFVDLPGLIQNADSSLIKLIERLTTKEISEPNTIIVIAMPMSDDYQLMQAVKIAKEVDPSGNRTLGVLTKPDSLSAGASGSREDWRLIIEGKNHKTAHGYFCVRLPDDEERKSGKTPAEMELLAKDFFNSQRPWSDMQDQHGHRFGVKNLVQFISPLLMKMIENNLVPLLTEVEDRLAKAKKNLAALPVLTIDNPAVEIMMRITSFCDNITDEIFGKRTHKLTQSSRSVYDKLKSDIQGTRPHFNVQPWQLTLAQASGPTHGNSSLDIASVRDEIRKMTGWELPGHIPFEATENFILRHINPWKQITFDRFEEAFDILDSFVSPLQDHHFKPYYYLLRHVRQHVQALLLESKKNCSLMLEKLLNLEQKPVYTWNTEILAEQETAWLSCVEDNHGRTLSNQSSFVAVNRQELTVMAQVYAYFQVAHRRFIDYVPLMMEHELKQTFASTLKKKLLESIFPPSPNGLDDARINQLMSEDIMSANKRARLVSEIGTLTKIHTRLIAFGARPVPFKGSWGNTSQANGELPPSPPAFHEEVSRAPSVVIPSGNNSDGGLPPSRVPSCYNAHIPEMPDFGMSPPELGFLEAGSSDPCAIPIAPMEGAKKKKKKKQEPQREPNLNSWF